MGHRYEASKRNVRILLYGHYRITYLVKADGDIDILGVFHGALDIGKYSL
jgi:plasmid stabilization system protein ParE